MLLSLFLLINCLGCQSNQDQVYSQAMEEVNKEKDTPSTVVQPVEEDENDTLSGELTLRTTVAGNILNYYVIFFHQLHSNVIIHVEPTYTDVREWGQNPERHTQQLATELMSGEAGDLVDIGLMDLLQVCTQRPFRGLKHMDG